MGSEIRHRVGVVESKSQSKGWVRGEGLKLRNLESQKPEQGLKELKFRA